MTHRDDSRRDKSLWKKIIICLALFCVAVTTSVLLIVVCQSLALSKLLTEIITHVVGFGFGLMIVYQIRK